MIIRYDWMTGAEFADTHQLPLAANTVRQWAIVGAFAAATLVIGMAPGIPAPKQLSSTIFDYQPEDGGGDAPDPPPTDPSAGQPVPNHKIDRADSLVV